MEAGEYPLRQVVKTYKEMKYRNIHISPKYSEGDKVYYGSIPEVPEIEMIEAPTIDEFERLFHYAVDEYLMEKKGSASKRRHGWLYFVLALIALIVIALVTCPDKSKHVEVLKDKVGSVLIEQIAGENAKGDDVLGRALVNGVVGQYLKNSLTVQDYALFNVGKFTYEGESVIVSLGAFGHVFSVPKKLIEDRLKENEDFQRFLDIF
jgi:hypothetical protein